ncbi:unnamed protein product [Prorocentrum cordatum]|uniref:Uncharacterized protein n=1 Tax=Prorocentrum cordatum TaxID=2364126 RepID=A0ABN9W6S3_9DINO|nr:unnamed protein product [Polarella glacialis]
MAESDAGAVFDFRGMRGQVSTFDLLAFDLLAFDGFVVALLAFDVLDALTFALLDGFAIDLFAFDLLAAHGAGGRRRRGPPRRRPARRLRSLARQRLALSALTIARQALEVAQVQVQVQALPSAWTAGLKTAELVESTLDRRRARMPSRRCAVHSTRAAWRRGVGRCSTSWTTASTIGSDATWRAAVGPASVRPPT